MKNKYSLGVLYCLVATVSWGCMFPVMTSALRQLDPFTFTALRYSIAGLAFLAILLSREGFKAINLKGEKVFLAWVFGTLGFAGFGFLAFLGQKLAGPTGALTASIIMATMPMQGLLVGWVLRGAKPAPLTMGFIGMSFFGVVLVITKGTFSNLLAPENITAYAPLLLGALSWVIYTVGASYFPHWSAYRYTTVTTLLGLVSVFAITFALIILGYVPAPSSANVAAIIPHLLYMALVAGLVGVLCWNLGNKILTPLNGVLFMDVVPITAFIVSALTGVVPTHIQVYGACITATALVLNNLYQRQKLAVVSPAPTRTG